MPTISSDMLGYRFGRDGRPTYKYHCGDRTCGAPDCGSCRNGTPPWEEEQEDEEPQLQWTDKQGQVHVGPADEMMRAAFSAGCHSSLTSIDDTPTETTMNPTLSCMNTECGNADAFGFDRDLHLNYCRDCGTMAGLPWQQSDYTIVPVIAPVIAPAEVVEPQPFEGTWTKWNGDWQARIPVRDGEDVPPGARVVVRRKSGATANRFAADTLRRFTNTGDDAVEFPFVAIVALAEED